MKAFCLSSDGPEEEEVREEMKMKNEQNVLIININLDSMNILQLVIVVLGCRLFNDKCFRLLNLPPPPLHQRGSPMQLNPQSASTAKVLRRGRQKEE